MPVIVTIVPTGPLAGENEVMVGTCPKPETAEQRLTKKITGNNNVRVKFLRMVIVFCGQWYISKGYNRNETLSLIAITPGI